MGLKYFSDELPVHKATVDSWITAVINARLAQANGIAPLGADGIVPAVHLPEMSLTWGSITGTLSNQTDLLTALGAKASTDSPAFTGTPTAPKATQGTNTLQIASTSFVQDALGTIPTASVSSTPTEITGDTTYTDIIGKYLLFEGTALTEVTLPSSIGLAESAFSFIIRNSGTSYLIVRTSDGGLLEAISPNKVYVFSVNDNTVANGYKLLVELAGASDGAVMTPMLEVYKTSITESVTLGAPEQYFDKIELSADKWWIMYTPVSSNTYTYGVIMTKSAGVYSFGTPVDLSVGGTYGGIWCWKQKADGSLIAFGLHTGSGANYIQSASISGTTITLGTRTAVQTSTASYQADTTRGVRLDDNRALLHYIDSAVGDPSNKIATVNGTGWTFGAEYTVSTSGSYQGVLMLSPTEFLSFYFYSFTKVKKGTISGSTITYGAEQTLLIGGSTTALSAQQYDLTKDYVCGGVKSDGQTCVTLLSGTGGTFLVMYSISATGVWTELGTIQLTTSSSESRLAYMVSDSTFVVMYGVVGDYTLYVIDISGSTPVLSHTLPVANADNIDIKVVQNINAVAGGTSLTMDIFDQTNERAGYVEMSTGGKIL